MAKHIKTDQTTTVQLAGDGSQWVLDKGIMVDVVDTSGIYNADADDLSLTIEGTVRSVALNVSYHALWIEGANNTIHVADSGRILGTRGIEIDGADAHVINDGKLLNDMDVGSGIDGQVDGFLIENNGVIRADRAIHFFGDGKVINGAESLIAGDTAVELIGDTGSVVINRGQMLGETWGFRSGDGDDRLVNRGTLTGDIDTGAGNDRIDLRRGDFSGEITGGEGGDTYLVDENHLVISEFSGQGYDLVWASSDFALDQIGTAEIEFLGAKGKGNFALTGNFYDNTIAGNAGKNDMIGDAGEDTFYSGAGDDWMQGGDDSDIFAFRKGDGHDVIDDFAFDGADQDIVDLHFLARFNTLDDVLAIAKDTADGVVLKLGKDDSLTIEDVTVADLKEAHFDFA